MLRLLTLATMLVPSATPAQSSPAEPATVTARPIATFKRAQIGEPVDDLIFRGGLILGSDHPLFGGLSGLSFIDADTFVMVTDEGQFVSGTLLLDNGAPSQLADVEIDVIRNSSGNPLPTKFSADSEAVDVVFRNGEPAAVRVGFEHLARLADFDLIDNRPKGPARPVPIPDWLTAVRDNESIESVCIAPPSSPVAGSTLVITEGFRDRDGNWAATLLGNADRGDLSLIPAYGVNPTDCAFLPNGDLLVLERGLAFLSFSVRIRHVPAQDVRAGMAMEGTELLSAAGSEVDNFEGIGVRVLDNGETRITIISDDNFNRFQRTLLLEFALP